jgi:hypothetical protein
MKTLRTREEVEREFDELTDESKLRQRVDYANEWLEAHTNEHLFEDSVYGEPMFDLSKKKVKSHIFSIRQQDLQVIKEWAERTDRLIENPNDEIFSQWDLGYSQALRDLTTFLNSQEVNN